MPEAGGDVATKLGMEAAVVTRERDGEATARTED